MYAYGHYFSGAINMCCDLGAFNPTSHTCLLLAEACFKSVTSVFSLNQFGVTPILDSPTKDKEIFFFLFQIPRLIGLFCMVASDLADWKTAAIEGQSFALCLFGEVWGCHWKHAIFYIFAPCHQIRMRCSDHCSLCSCLFFFFKCKDRLNERKLNQSHSTDKAGKNCPCLQWYSQIVRHCILCGVYLGLFFSIYAVSVVPFQCNVLFFCVFVVSFFPLFPSPTLPSPSPPAPGAAFCPAQAGRRTRKLPIWPCPWPCVFFLCHSHSPHL